MENLIKNFKPVEAIPLPDIRSLEQKEIQWDESPIKGEMADKFGWQNEYRYKNESNTMLVSIGYDEGSKVHVTLLSENEECIVYLDATLKKVVDIVLYHKDGIPLLEELWSYLESLPTSAHNALRRVCLSLEKGEYKAFELVTE